MPLIVIVLVYEWLSLSNVYDISILKQKGVLFSHIFKTIIFLLNIFLTPIPSLISFLVTSS